MNLSFIPNLITILRFILVVPLVWYLWNLEYGKGLAIFMLAGFSDGLDGLLAKRFQWTSRFGAIADPLADKLLLVSSLLLLATNGDISWWLFAVVTLRDIVIVSGALIYHYVIGPYRMSPSWISKANTAFQILLVVLILANLSMFAIPGWVIGIMVGVVWFTSIASGLHYVWLWGGRFRDILEQRRPDGKGASL